MKNFNHVCVCVLKRGKKKKKKERIRSRVGWILGRGIRLWSGYGCCPPTGGLLLLLMREIMRS